MNSALNESSEIQHLLGTFEIIITTTPTIPYSTQ